MTADQIRTNPYWLAPSIAIAVPLLLGPLGAWLDMLRADTAFFLVGLAVFLALVATSLLGAASAYASATGRSWRRSALRAAILPALVTGGTLGFLSWNGAADLNDVSTDLAERPVFSQDGAEPADEASALRLEYFASQQRRAYPDLEPLLVAGPAAPAFERALEAARAMPGWEIARSDPSKLEIEARARTRVFGFVDDVAIRVRSQPGGARIDVRSRSSQRRIDFGANAARIRSFASALRQAVERAGEPEGLSGRSAAR